MRENMQLLAPLASIPDQYIRHGMSEQVLLLLQRKFDRKHLHGLKLPIDTVILKTQV